MSAAARTATAPGSTTAYCEYECWEEDGETFIQTVRFKAAPFGNYTWVVSNVTTGRIKGGFAASADLAHQAMDRVIDEWQAEDGVTATTEPEESR